jgi:sarcosine oxidase
VARSPDVAVVGGGIVGLAVADALARGGASVVVLERGVPGAGQSAGEARGFRHLHATAEEIADAVRARALWDDWSARAGEQLVGEEGALRLGGDVQADAARLRAAGVAAEVVAAAGEREPALAHDAGPLLWDPRGGAIRARRAIDWLAGELGARLQRADVRAIAPGRVDTSDGAIACGRVVLCAGAGTERLWPHVRMRRVVHLRVTFEVAAGGRADPGSWGAATWADRSGRFGAATYGVADGPGRFALGLAELDAHPAPDDPLADAVPASTDLSEIRARVLDYAAAAFPGLGRPVEEVVRLLTVLPGDNTQRTSSSGTGEDRYAVAEDGDAVVVAGHNLFKLAPLLGERVAGRLRAQLL